MATARATANVNVALAQLFQVPLHMKGIIDSVNIDNQGTSGPITVQLEDDFIQDISQGNNVPTARSAFPFQTTVTQNTSVSADELSTEKIECLGNVGVVCNKTDAGCAIVVDYHFE